LYSVPYQQGAEPQFRLPTNIHCEEGNYSRRKGRVALDFKENGIARFLHVATERQRLSAKMPPKGKFN
jgi:hypothetical protein